MTTAARFDFRDVARLEVVKWVAFVAMVIDHVDLALFDRGQPWMHAIGAFCLPAFALAFGLGLARSRDPLGVATRLVIPGVIAQAAWAIVDGQHAANVLIMFAACCGPAAFLEAGKRTAAAVCLAVLLLVSVGGEGGPPLVALVAGGYAASKLGKDWSVWVAGALWWGLVPSVGAALAVAAVAWWPPSSLAIARRPGWLAWAYAAHLVALAIAAGVSSS